VSGAGRDDAGAKTEPMAKSRARRPSWSRLALRWSGVAVLCLVGFLYFRPAKTYFEKRADLQSRAADVQRLRAQNTRLQRRVAISNSDAALGREARRLGFVRPGEQLFIVKGIADWRRKHGDARRDG
jgi:cell division protein FtsB